MKNHLFYGWYVVFGVLFGQLFLTGFMTYAFGLLVVPIQQEFSATRAELMYGLSISTFMGLFLAPVIGSLVDKKSVRLLMSTGALLLGCGLLVLSLTQSVIQFSIVFGVTFSFANLLLGPVTGSTTVSRWFTVHRGKALGVAAFGTSIGGLLIPLLVSYWLEKSGWRWALQGVGLCVLCLVMPYLLLLMRGRPEELNLLADGAEPARVDVAVDTPQSVAMAELRVADLIAMRSFWLLGIAMGLLFAVYSSMMSNLPAYAVGLGVSTTGAGWLLTTVAGTGLLGKLIFGLAADRVNLRLALMVAMALLMAGLLILATEPSYTLMILAAVLFGMAAGGILPVWGAMIAVVFGTANYGKVMGFITPMITLIVMPGYQVAGQIYDRTGSYALAFYLFSALLVLAAGLLTGLRMPGHRAT
jgi:MFS family permease